MPTTPLPPGTASEGYYISDEDRYNGTQNQFESTLFDVDMPEPTAAGGYVSRAMQATVLRERLGVNLGPNERPGMDVSVRFLTKDDPRFDPISDHALEDIDTTRLCLGATAKVNFEPVDYVLVYDSDPNRPGGPFGAPQCWRDGYYKYPTPMVPCKWAPENSEEAVGANVPYYDVAFNSDGTPPGYPVGYEVRYTPAGGSEGHYVADAAGQLAAPGTVAEQWHQVAPPMPPQALYQALPYGVAVRVAGAYALVDGREYLITERPGGGPAARGSFSRTHPTAFMQYATLEGQDGAFTYDLETDTATALNTSGGSTLWQAGGAPYVAGQFVHNSQGQQFRTLQANASHATEPTLPLSAGLAPYYSFVGWDEARVGVLEATQQQHTQQLAANTTALATKADLVAGKVPGTQLPGATATTAGILRLGKGLYGNGNITAVDFVSEVVTDFATDNDANSTLIPGSAYALSGFASATLSNIIPTATGRLISVRNTGTADCVVATYNNVAMGTLRPGEMAWYKALAGNHNFEQVLHVPTHGPLGTGGGPAPAGIDYAAPVQLAAAATLQANKAHYVSGAGYALTLPDAAANLGAAVFVQIAANATGLYALTGTSYQLYAKESLLLRATADGWVKTAGELLAMSARLETTPAQQDALVVGNYSVIPLGTAASANGPAGLLDPTGRAIVVQRAGRAVLNATVALQNATVNGQYFVVITRGAGTPNDGAQTLGAAYAVVAGNGFAIATLSVAVAVAAGDVLKICVYAGQSANLLGQAASNVCALTFTELT